MLVAFQAVGSDRQFLDLSPPLMAGKNVD